jgi:hypothetical protein
MLCSASKNHEHLPIADRVPREASVLPARHHTGLVPENEVLRHGLLAHAETIG